MKGIFDAQIHINQNKYFCALLLFRENRIDLRNFKTRKFIPHTQMVICFSTEFKNHLIEKPKSRKLTPAASPINLFNFQKNKI